VKVKVLYFASLREQLGVPFEEVDLADASATVGDLRKLLSSRGGSYEKAFAGKTAIRAAVNQDMAQPTAPIKAGDEVAFFPPVTGG
jgi:molybdopterin synthase sulfur carrier subunit